MENDDYFYPDVKEYINETIERLRQLQSGTCLNSSEIDDLCQKLNNVYTRLVLVGE